MRKDELVQLHALLSLLRGEYVRCGLAPQSAFEAYDELEVSPLAVYASKDDHARAVQTLAIALAGVSDDSTGRSTAVPSR